ncbi:retron Ec78 anti-phage system effector HNH endonuclease PtuB [Endozoicomonas acroporae]|uniref:retron Ec78 anti-phage system effector HNH endonuclease PtuB n=1 Tax=Endozoicomonas acroporae TaxID=1701104 RepID=UPI0013CF41DA|nr:retron Ec78 anti-phage system effector HNH endonuclease PtuB [Endozoicomonas acroporae]
MKKISKSAEPDALTEFRQQHPDAQWREFRDNGPYANIKQTIFEDQGHLCAFCEVELPADRPSHQRVEHFHPKSDQSNPAHNWALDWNNMIGVCMGGSKQNSYPTPDNLSCDAHKDYLINTRKLSEACEGYVLNPLRIINTPCLFKFDKRTCELSPDPEACARLADVDNQYESLVQLVEETIRILNLNCARLVDDRKKVFYHYERLLKQARSKGLNPRQYKAKLAEQWFRSRWPSFFTTRRILLGQAAEEWLAGQEYQG